MRKKHILMCVVALVGFSRLVEASVSLSSGKELLDDLLRRNNCTPGSVSDQLYSDAQFELFYFLLEQNPEALDTMKALYLDDPMHVAAASGHVSAIEMLAKCGLSLESVDRFFRQTPLQRASEAGRYGAVTVLVERGADVNKPDFEGKTPLHLAAEGGHMPIVRFLVEHGASVNAQDAQANTALHLASKGGHQDTVEFLIRNNDAAIQKNMKNQTPLSVALESYILDGTPERAETVKRLLLLGVAPSQDDRKKMDQFFSNWQKWVKEGFVDEDIEPPRKKPRVGY